MYLSNYTTYRQNRKATNKYYIHTWHSRADSAETNRQSISSSSSSIFQVWKNLNILELGNGERLIWLLRGNVIKHILYYFIRLSMNTNYQTRIFVRTSSWHIFCLVMTPQSDKRLIVRLLFSSSFVTIGVIDTKDKWSYILLLRII